MFNFKKIPKGDTVEIKVNGMHCVSCSLNIDDLLESVEGVISSNTSYAKAKTKVEYLSDKISVEKLINLIKEAGYKGRV